MKYIGNLKKHMPENRRRVYLTKKDRTKVFFLFLKNDIIDLLIINKYKD